MGDPMDGMSRLDRAARARGLDVLLERPGRRWRLAIQTARASVRTGAPWVRSQTTVTEPTRDDINRAARLLLDDLTRRT